MKADYCDLLLPVIIIVISVFFMGWYAGGLTSEKRWQEAAISMGYASYETNIEGTKFKWKPWNQVKAEKEFER